MTLHIASSGIALLQGLLSRPHSVVGISSALADAIEDAAPDRLLTRHGAVDGTAADALLRECFGPNGSVLRRDVEAMLPMITPGSWPDSVSPEIDSFARTPGGRRILADDDVAVLLATDTSLGLTAALWNGVTLTGGDLDRIEYLSDPTETPLAPRGRVLLVRVPDLDARDERGFARAMRGLGTLGRNLAIRVATPRDEPCLFHLSGGYKAAIPYLIGLAEGLRSLPGAGPVNAYVLHETTQGDPIRLPLRRIHPELIQPLAKLFDRQGVCRGPLDTNELEGYAYDRDGSGQWRLTSFGEGLVALFGRPTEGLGA